MELKNNIMSIYNEPHHNGRYITDFLWMFIVITLSVVLAVLIEEGFSVPIAH